jgi:fructose-1,6-bisphosphatase/inositol monophosphatase family enzyme
MSSTIKLSQVVNACVVLSQTAGTVIRQRAPKSKIGLIQKGASSLDVCTETDLRIQRNLQYNLKALYPKAKIICEEDEAMISSDITPTILPDQVLREVQNQSIFSESSLVKAAKGR